MPATEPPAMCRECSGRGRRRRTRPLIVALVMFGLCEGLAALYGREIHRPQAGGWAMLALGAAIVVARPLCAVWAIWTVGQYVLGGCTACKGTGRAPVGVDGLREIPFELAVSLRHQTNCLGCGYDLTGVQSEVCPECGKRHYRAISE